MPLSKLTVPSVIATCQPPSAVHVLTAVIVGPLAELTLGISKGRKRTETRANEWFGGRRFGPRGKSAAVLARDLSETVHDSCNKECGTSTVERLAREKRKKTETFSIRKS